MAIIFKEIIKIMIFAIKSVIIKLFINYKCFTKKGIKQIEFFKFSKFIF